MTYWPSEQPSCSGCRAAERSRRDSNLKAIDGRLGLATMRTKGTIDQLHAKFMASG